MSSLEYDKRRHLQVQLDKALEEIKFLKKNKETGRMEYQTISPTAFIAALGQDVYKGDDASAAFRLIAGARGKSLQGVLSKFLRKSDKHAKVLKGSDIGYNILQDRDKKLMHETFSPFIEDKDLISRRTKDLLKTSDIAYTGWEHENPLTTVRQDQTFIPDTQVKFPPIVTEPLFKNIKQELPQLKSGT